MTTPWRRLSGAEIKLLRYLAVMAHVTFAVRLGPLLRQAAVPLWRRRIVDCWYRQVPDCQPSLQGPYFNLTARGARLAEAFTRPRASAAPSSRRS